MSMDVRATSLLGQWWRQPSHRAPLARCRSFGDKFRAFRSTKAKAAPMASKFCCRQWRLCEP